MVAGEPESWCGFWILTVSHVSHASVHVRSPSQFFFSRVLSLQGFSQVEIPSDVFDWFHSKHGQHARTFAVGQAGAASIPGTVLAMMNGAIGATVLALPYVFSLMGWALGAATMLFIGLCSTFTSVILVRTAHAEDAKTYDELIGCVLGPLWLRMYQLLMVASSIGTLIGLLILCGDFVMALSLQAAHPSPGTAPTAPITRPVAVAVCGFVLVLPLALKRTLASMWFTSYLSVAFIAILVAFVATQSVQHGIHPTVRAMDTSILDYFQGVSIIVLSYSSQTSILPLVREMRDKSVAGATTVSHTNAVLVTAVYMAVG